MAVVNSMDGIYFLVSEDWNGSNPPVPSPESAPGAPWVASEPDILAVSTLSTWTPTRVFVSEVPSAPYVEEDAWERVAYVTATVQSAMKLADMEFDEHEDPDSLRPPDAAGEYGFVVLARSHEFALTIGVGFADEPQEQHTIFWWPR